MASWGIDWRREARSVHWIISAIILGLLVLPAVKAQTNLVLAATPPMGWNSWNAFRCNISANLLEQIAQAMATNGMKDAGYQYVIVDDCWALTSRDANGNVVPDPNLFPDGIKPVADYIHSLGLKFGIYTDAGTKTCEGRAGSYQHELQDAAAYASWGADYVKVDWCFSSGIDARAEYGVFSNALQAAGRPMVFSICNWGNNSPWIWGPHTGNLWRTTPDIGDSWNSVISITDASSVHAAAAGRGHWNDPDMLEVGNGGMSITEYQSHFSLWAMMAAPLIAGNDLRSMSPSIISILTNTEVIAVDQDPLGVQGVKVNEAVSGLQVWARPLQKPGARAVLLLNRSYATQPISFAWSDIGLGPGPATVRDLWQHADEGIFSNQYSASVDPAGVVMLIIRGSEPPPPTNAAYVSDMAWTYAVNTLGPVERDRSNGGADAGDGQTISIRGQSYPKGIGCDATAAVRVHLGGNGSRFISDIGLDDEVATNGTGFVVFEVWGDDALLFRSDVLSGTSTAQTVNVDVTGKQDLWLRALADPAHDEGAAHADWAGARVLVLSSNGDGIPDAWRQQYFGGDGTTTNDQSCALCDPDHDGRNNLTEFLTGTDPTNDASFWRIQANPTNGAAPLVVSFSENSAEPSIVDRLWTFGDGGNGNGSNLTHIYASPGTFSVGLTVSSPYGTASLVASNLITVSSLAIWTNANADGNWSDASNWDPVAIPDDDCSVMFGTGGATATVDNVSRTVSNIIFSRSGGFGITAAGGAILTINCGITVTNTFAYTIAAPVVLGRTNIWSVTSNGILRVTGPIDGANPLLKTGLGTLILSGTNNYSGVTTVSNGVLEVAGEGLLTNTPSIDLASGATWDGSGCAGGSLMLATGQTLLGNGTVKGDLIIGSGASLSPGGDSVGVLTFLDDLVVSNAAILQFDLGTNSDQLTVSSNLTLGGILNIKDSGGLTTGVYTLVTYGGALTYDGVVIDSNSSPSYAFTIDTNTTGQVKLDVAAAVSTIFVDAGDLQDGLGNLEATNSVAVLVADMGNNGFPSPQPSSALSLGAMWGADDRVVGLWDLSACGCGEGRLFDQTAITYLNGIVPGQKLQLYWFPSLTLASNTIGSTFYGKYSDTNSPPFDGSDAWQVPAGETSVHLRFSTAARGGTNPQATGRATLPTTAYLGWQMQYFNCTECPQASADADPDGDGQGNLTEFLAGTDPTNAASSWFIQANPGSGASPLTVTFSNNSSAASITNRSWDFGDGSSGNGVNPSHTYSNVGTFSVGLRLFNLDGVVALVATNLVTVSPPPPYWQAVTDESPFAYWRLNETNGATVAIDVLGLNNGTINANVNSGVAGPSSPLFPGFETTNTAAELNSLLPNSYLTMPALNLNTNAVTIIGWINPANSQNGWAGIVFCRGGSTVAGLHFGPGSIFNELRYTWNNDGNTFNRSTGLSVPTNQWSFFALVVCPTNSTIYLGTNGILEASTQIINLPIQEFEAPLCLGYDPSSGGRPFNGRLDEIAVYNHSLTAAQIQQLYHSVWNEPPWVAAFRTWQMQHFGCTNCSQAAETADPDGDGQNNRMEFLAGTDPTNSASAFQITSIAQEGEDVRIVWLTVGGRTNMVQAASAISSDYSNASSNIIIAGSGDTSTNFLDTGAATNLPGRFYRVRLVP
ncbi:MAG TPA: NPCBM/NEW2 domain-containing protein [Verrucomicrobiae bacterium]|nr:NPCBM/NEW2 domain-containing protein [Verrucomicrobiae bacterium]